MATDLYTDSQEQVGGRTTALAQLHADTKTGIATYEKTASDNDTSVLRFFKDVPVEMTLAEVTVMCDAISGATDTDFGIYLPNGGAVLDKDLFMDGQTLASASKVLDGMAALAIEYRGKTIKEAYEAVNATTLDPSVRAVDLCLTGNTFGTNTGTITIRVRANVQ